MIAGQLGGSFEARYAAERLRAFCEDRARSAGLRVLFATLLLLIALVAGAESRALAVWLVAVCLAQWADARASSGHARRSREADKAGQDLPDPPPWYGPLMIASTAVYAASIPIALTSETLALQLAGAAMGFGSMAAVSWRATNVPQLLWPMMAVYFSALVAGVFLAVTRQSELGLPAAIVCLLGYCAVLGQAAQMARYGARETRRLAEAAHRASLSAQAKGAFLATASHELRTPLNAIIGSVELMARDPDTCRHGDLLETVRTASRSLVRQLDDILDVARIEAGRIELDPQPFDPRALVSHLQTLWSPAAAAKGLLLEICVDGSVPAGLDGDAHRLSQIVSNLVSNAIKFTSDGSVRMTVARAQGQLIIDVADTGCGMDADAAAGLFAPFRQVGADAARLHGGSGLGLAIARGLAIRMGGTLVLASEPGRGTVATLQIPMAAAGLPVAPAPGPDVDRIMAAGPQPVDRAAGADDRAVSDIACGREASRPQQPGVPVRRVLVAEDNPASMMILCRLLELAGIDTVRCHDGAQAVAAARQQGFDALLLDVRMPVMDGLAATRTIRAGPGPNRHAPVIMLSADASRQDRAAGLAAGADLYLTKPIEPARLLAALECLPGPHRLAPSGTLTAEPAA